jgi:hypothetical protein
MRPFIQAKNGSLPLSNQRLAGKAITPNATDPISHARTISPVS